MKNLPLLFVFILLYNTSFAIVGESQLSTVNSNLTPKKSGFLKKIQEKIITKKLKKVLSKIESDDCDIISLYLGYEFIVNVIEIQEKKVLYQLCNEPDSPIESLTCDDINIIYLADGSQYKCSHPNLPRRSDQALFVKSAKNELVQVNQKCDILVLTNKDQMDVDIVDIKKNQLFYKTCGDQTSVIDSIDLSEIRTYRKKNGYAQRVNLYGYEIRSTNRTVNNSPILNLLRGLVLVALGVVLALIIIINL